MYDKTMMLATAAMLLLLPTASGVAPTLSVQREYCASAADFTNETVVMGSCKIDDDNIRNASRELLCVGLGAGYEVDDDECEGPGMDAFVCNSIEGEWEETTCAMMAWYLENNLLPQGASTSNSTICGTQHYIQIVQMLESRCCGGNPGADTCPPPQICADPDDFTPSDVFHAQCEVLESSCVLAGFKWDREEEECDDVPQSECAGIGGTWQSYTCEMGRSRLQQVATEPYSCNDTCTEEARVLMTLEFACCGGKSSLERCGPRKPVCNDMNMFNMSAIATGTCELPHNGSRQAAIDACKALGRYEEDDEGQCMFITEAECATIPGARWQLRTCGEGLGYMMRFSNMTDFCKEGWWIASVMAENCCDGTPGTNLCNPGGNTAMCASNDDFFPENSFFKQCKLCRGYDNVEDCPYQELSLNCTELGGWMDWDDGSCKGPAIDFDKCQQLNGEFENIPCSFAQMYIDGNNVTKICEDEQEAMMTTMTDNCCADGTATNLCGIQPAQVCESGTFSEDAALYPQCKLCREIGGDNGGRCGDGDGRGGDGRDDRGGGGDDCGDGRGSQGSGSGIRRSRRNHLGSGAGSGYYNADASCGPRGSGSNGSDDGNRNPVCANRSTMISACQDAGGVFNPLDQTCMGITHSECNTIRGAIYDPIFCREAPYYLARQANNMTLQCLDPDVRPKIEVLDRCCIGGDAISFCDNVPGRRRNFNRTAARIGPIFVLAFRGNLNNMSNNTRDAFKLRILQAIIARSGGRITMDMILDIVLIARSRVRESARRQTTEDYIDAEIVMAEDVTVQQVTDVLEDIDQNALDIEVDGETYTVDVAASTASLETTTVAPDGGSGDGAGELVPSHLLLTSFALAAATIPALL